MCLEWQKYNALDRDELTLFRYDGEYNDSAWTRTEKKTTTENSIAGLIRTIH